MSMRTEDDLHHLIRLKAAEPAAAVVQLLSEAVRKRHGAAVQAVLFYGSCRRSGDDRGGMVDLYAIVDRYRAAYGSRGLSVLNWLLPPNVFYLEVEGEGRVVRCKYAVLSMRISSAGFPAAGSTRTSGGASRSRRRCSTRVRPRRRSGCRPRSPGRW